MEGSGAKFGATVGVRVLDSGLGVSEAAVAYGRASHCTDGLVYFFPRTTRSLMPALAGHGIICAVEIFFISWKCE